MFYRVPVSQIYRAKIQLYNIHLCIQLPITCICKCAEAKVIVNVCKDGRCLELTYCK